MTKKGWVDLKPPKPFWFAGAFAYRAGYNKPVHEKCGHRHRTRSAAEKCAEKQPTRLGPRKLRYWRAVEVVYFRVLAKKKKS